MKFGDFAPGWNKIFGCHKTYKLKHGDRITTKGNPDIKDPYCTVFDPGYAGHSAYALGWNEEDICVYTKHGGHVPEKEAKTRLPLNPIFSKPLPLP